MLTTVKTYLRAHKIISSIVVIVVAGGGYYWYSSAHAAPSVTKYVVDLASQGTVVADVSGTGQVQAGTTINVTPKVSEEVTSIPVKVGQHVSAGQLLVQLDPTNEQRSLASAELSLEQAQLSAQQSNQVATTTLLQQKNAVTTDQQSIINASTSLTSDYQVGFNNLGPAFVNMQTVMNGLKNFITGYDISKSQQDPDALVALLPSEYQSGVLTYRNQAVNDYNDAEAAYSADLAAYQKLNSSASPSAMDSLFVQTNNTAQSIAAAAKSAKDFIDSILNTYQTLDSTKQLPSITTTLDTNMGSYQTTINSTVSNTQTTITGIANDRNNISNAQNSLEQASETLAETLAGPTQTTLLGQQISIQSAQNNLTTAQQNLAYTSVRAPIAGTVSAIAATVGQTAGSNAVTMVGDGEVAQITLNEVDAAKVMTGDKATLTFDALPDLSLAGTVVEIDPVGTVSQGVVSYNVQIGFSQPANTSSSMLVKPGMSVTADVVTQADQNVIAVPNAAVVTSGGSTYVLEPATALSAADLTTSESGGIVLSGGTKEVPVTVGISSDTMTEITSGVNVGDQIIVQTIKSSATTKTTASTGGNALQLLGGAGGGGGTRTFRTGAGG